MDIKNLYSELDPQRIYQNFLQDLELSAKGEKTSLRFIANQLPTKLSVLQQGIQVLVIGGTFCKSAFVKVVRGKVEIRDIQDISKPPFPTEESFLSFVAGIISPDVNEVVINSADTIKPIYENGKMDGIFIATTKENRMEGLLNKKIGKEIELYIEKNNGRKISVTVANDTICLLLSGLTKYIWDAVAGGIIGTGINLAFFLNETMAINIEAGGFSNFTQSDPGHEIDRLSEEPGEYKFEKETSGGYLYKHFNFFLQKYEVSLPQITNSAELSEIAKEDSDYGSMARQVLGHSATLAACQIAGLVTFLQKDITFVMQGSVFWKGYGYKEKIQEIVSELVHGYSVKFVEIPDADILGAAEVLI